MIHPIERERGFRQGRLDHVTLGAVAILAFSGLGATQSVAQEEEEERVLRICERVGQSEVEIGIEGVVRDKDSEVPLPGSTVVIRYENERGLETPEDVTIVTDEEGRYQACGLVAFREVRIRGAYGVHRGDERKIDLDRPKFVDLDVDLGDDAFVVLSIVTSDEGRPIPGARVTLAPLPIAGVSDSLGRVAFRSIPPGVYDMRVEHIAFETREEELSVLTDQSAEMRVELTSQAIAVAPLEIIVTGRDPHLLTSGFYERRGLIEEGYFATNTEITPYVDLGQLFRFKSELSVKFRRRQLILINGRPANRLGFNAGNIREINMKRVRGIEAYRCSEAPPEILNQVPNTLSLFDCNLVAIWTR